MKFTLYFLLLCGSLRSYGQCCSPGSPTTGTVNQGTLAKKNLRSILLYQFGNSKDFFTGSSKSGVGAVQYASYNYLNFNIAYGITSRFTAELTGGYSITRKQVYSVLPPPDNKLIGNGFSDFIMQGKYSWIKNKTKQLELTTGLGLQLPITRKAQEKNGVLLARDVQPATNATGFVASLFLYKGFMQKKTNLFFASQIIVPGKNDLKYQVGNTWINAFFVSYSIKYPWSVTLQVRDEMRTKDYRTGQLIAASGSRLLFFSPQANYTFGRLTDVSLLFDLPLYRYYNGTQLAKQFNISIVASRLFEPKQENKLSKQIVY